MEPRKPKVNMDVVMEIVSVDHSDRRVTAVIPINKNGTSKLTQLTEAVNDLTLSTVVTGLRVRRNERYSGSVTPPTDPQAQNELVWIVTYRDVITLTTEQLLLYGADATFLVPQTDEIDYSQPEVVDFIEWFEKRGQSSLGNDIAVLTIFISGN